MTPEDIARLLNLQRPLIFLDLETTTPEGAPYPDANVDRIVELGVMKIYPDGKVTQFATYVDPGQPMNPDSTATNKITDAMLEGAKPFTHWARIVLAGIGDSDFAGFNESRYDKKVLVAEFRRAGITWDPSTARWVDLYLLWAHVEPRDQAAFLRRVGIEPDEEASHRAAVDVAGVVVALPAFLDLFPDLPRTVDELAALTERQPNPNWLDPDGKIQWVRGVATVCFGKHADKAMTAIPSDYWRDFILKKDFGPEMKALAANALNGVYPTRQDDGAAAPFVPSEPTLFPVNPIG